MAELVVLGDIADALIGAAFRQDLAASLFDISVTGVCEGMFDVNLHPDNV
jgi:hypothetical protein